MEKQRLIGGQPPPYEYYQIDPDPEPLKAVTLQSHNEVPVIECGLGGWWYAGQHINDLHSYLQVLAAAAPAQYRGAEDNEKSPLCKIIEDHINKHFTELMANPGRVGDRRDWTTHDA